jgi:hypothetical protein
VLEALLVDLLRILDPRLPDPDHLGPSLTAGEDRFGEAELAIVICGAEWQCTVLTVFI